MIKILNESLQDVDSFLKSEVKVLIEDQIPHSKKDPNDSEVNEFIMNRVSEEFPEDTNRPEIVSVAAIKVQGEETEVITTDHQVIKFNGYLYDYTAHRFVDEFNGLLTFGQVPVIQPVITNDSQINDKISTVKFYALVEY